MMNGMPITMLGNLGETRILYYANIDLQRHSKPPGDWFPLIDNVDQIAKGTLLGSVVEKKVIDGKNWYHFAVIGGWIMGVDKAFFTKTVEVQPLTEQQKIEIATGAIKMSNPNAEILIDTYEAGKKALNIGKYLVPALIGVAAIVGGAYVYNSFKS